MKIFVLTYSTNYEGDTVYGVTANKEVADRWKIQKSTAICDDGHDVHEFDHSDFSILVLDAGQIKA